MKKLLACAALLLAANLAHAQGVGINATGAPADTSAILDLSSTSKGLLVPRLTSAQRAAIALPATGLVVFQTDGALGLYWNAGTPASPSWKQVGEAGAGGGGQWSTSGSNIYYSEGNVAVGTIPGRFRFAVQDTGDVFRVQADSPNSVMASMGGFGQVQIDAPGDLRSGEVAEVMIRSKSPVEEKASFVIPALALTDARADQGVVYVMDAQGLARRRAVFTGGVTDEGVVILDGLTEGDAVITRGASMVRDGDKVRVAAQ